MWAKQYVVNIVTTKGSWYEEDALILQKSLDDIGLKTEVVFDHKNISPDSIAFYLSYQKIVEPEYINKAKRSLVIHASDLPQGKGFSPWVWQILEGKNIIPLCLFVMKESIDAGPIILKKYINLEGTELLPKIRKLLAEKIQEIVVEYLRADAEIIGIPQVGSSTYYRKRDSKDSEIDINKSIREQFNLLRVVDNYNYPAFFEYKGKKFILKVEDFNE